MTKEYEKMLKETQEKMIRRINETKISSHRKQFARLLCHAEMLLEASRYVYRFTKKNILNGSRNIPEYPI